MGSFQQTVLLLGKQPVNFCIVTGMKCNGQIQRVGTFFFMIGEKSAGYAVLLAVRLIFVTAGSDSKWETVSEEMLFCPRRSSKMIFEPVFSRIERLTLSAVCKIIAAHRISVLITRKQENRTMLLLFFRRR